jgi:hypothetical protein
MTNVEDAERVNLTISISVDEIVQNAVCIIPLTVEHLEEVNVWKQIIFWGEVAAAW